ncbi:hypothetical protein [Pseudoduganella chitinolytica]|uniref:Uncharacterized protein n=1 Tax=Pseudoduganella chitinolytica TaxID=34070 RepID=A0ABY8BBT3_9BURK|nr:hypothetical protein [Pseudoduganella chitinolytica]WEF32227.1 hypothetical protein PX653_22845 [Pseudoduganella chitinolytica]
MNSAIGRRAKREVVDVPEPRRPDQSLARLLHVRKQRLGRLERERNEARQQWRQARTVLRERKGPGARPSPRPAISGTPPARVSCR